MAANGANVAADASLRAAHFNFVTWLAGFIVAATKWLTAAMLRRRTRHALRELSDEMLRDIGITRADAMREASRPFWE